MELAIVATNKKSKKNKQTRDEVFLSLPTGKFCRILQASLARFLAVLLIHIAQLIYVL